jgi:hypothetical protein
MNMDMSFFSSYPFTEGLSVPRKSGQVRNADLISIHPEIDNFRMGHSALSSQHSAQNGVFMRSFLKAES